MTKIDDIYVVISLNLGRKTPIYTELEVGWHSQTVRYLWKWENSLDPAEIGNTIPKFVNLYYYSLKQVTWNSNESTN